MNLCATLDGTPENRARVDELKAAFRANSRANWAANTCACACVGDCACAHAAWIARVEYDAVLRAWRAWGV